MRNTGRKIKLLGENHQLAAINGNEMNTHLVLCGVHRRRILISRSHRITAYFLKLPSHYYKKFMFIVVLVNFAIRSKDEN